MDGGEVKIVELAVGRPPRRLIVADGLVDGEAAEAIYAHVRDLPFTLSDSDRPDTNRFKHFKHDFEIDPAQGDALMQMLAGKAREVMASLGIACGNLYRIYANLNLYGDFQFAHHDGDGWTALLFANPEWGEDWGGEILFHDAPGTPFAYAIAPRPRGMLIVDGLITHRGGVPSKFCHLPRITLAIKFRR